MGADRNLGAKAGRELRVDADRELGAGEAGYTTEGGYVIM